MGKAKAAAKPRTRANTQAKARCLCGGVEMEIDVPAFWAWHDHSANSRRAHGAAYATYVGSYRTRFRILKGEDLITRFTEPDTARTRSFCKTCGTSLLYERGDSKPMVNIPRALFETRTGREPIYHIAIAQMQDWTYVGAPLGPLKGYPGVVWEKNRKKKRAAASDALFDESHRLSSPLRAGVGGGGTPQHSNIKVTPHPPLPARGRVEPVRA